MHLYNDNYSVLNGVGATTLEVQDAMLFGYGASAGTMPLRTQASFRILTWPNWNDFQSSWETPIRTYLSSFRASDDVCLVLRFDPQSVILPTQEIYERIEAMLPEYGLTDDTMPELLLVDDILDASLQARLFNSVNAFLQNSTDIADEIHSQRALESGLTLIPSGDSRTLRQAFDEGGGPAASSAIPTTENQTASHVSQSATPASQEFSDAVRMAQDLARRMGSKPEGPRNMPSSSFNPLPGGNNPSDVPPPLHP